MSKKILATNCKIMALPQGCTAKINGQGTAIITLYNGKSDIVGGTKEMMWAKVDGFHIVSFDEINMLCLGDLPANYDNTGFHDF